MPPRRKSALAAVPDKVAEQPHDLRDAVRRSLVAMTWLADSDKALADLAMRQAEEIETAVKRAEEFEALARDAAGDEGVFRRLKALEASCDVVKVVALLGPQLQSVIRDLGGSPAVRKELTAEAKKVGGRLALLREAAAAAGEHDS